MRSVSHWTPRYVFDRLLLAYWERSHPDQPWLTSAGIALLQDWLTPSDVVLECGSGRSTRWFAERVAQVVSVEHSIEWASIVRATLEQHGLTEKVRYCVHSDGADERPDSEYVQAVGALDDAGVDCALIDGMSRDHCAVAALPKIRPGGIVVIDNVDRYIPRASPSSAPGARGLQAGYASSTWKQFHDGVREWRCYWTSNGITDTAFWFRPCGR